MTGINHALTGALIAGAINRPILALPAAFLSHFATDFLPHWDYKTPPRIRRAVIGTDLFLSLVLPLILAFILIGFNPWLIFFGGFLAILPDAMWLPYIIEGKPAPMSNNNPLHLLRRLHAKIQWSETRGGLYFEIGWFVFIVAVLLKTGL